MFLIYIRPAMDRFTKRDLTAFVRWHKSTQCTPHSKLKKEELDRVAAENWGWGPEYYPGGNNYADITGFYTPRRVPKKEPKKAAKKEPKKAAKKSAKKSAKKAAKKK